MGTLDGKGALITGGGRGIGAAVARELSAAGAAVVVSARTEEEVERVAAEIRGGGGKAWALPCDVTDPQGVKELVKAAAERLGRVDVMVSNAGVASSAPLARITLEEWNRLFAVNATGTLLCAQAVIPAMVERGWGRVINVASVAGLTGARYIAAYAASKHAVLGFTRSVAAEVAAKGITVNAVCPGYVDTDMTRNTVERIQETTGISTERALDSILETAPHGRLVTSEEVADTVRWLAGDGAASVNGQAIVLDGGGLLA